jgi:hypothetical protein
MARIDLHLFERDLANKPGKGSSAPPRTIRAKDLDNNNKKLTLLQGEGSPPSYTVEYTPDGIRIRDIKGLPADAMAKQFAVCENGTAKEYWLLAWDEEPELGG